MGDLTPASLWLDQAVGHHVDGDLNAADALALTAKIKAYVGVTWILLSEAHQRRADKALGYKSWEAYVKAEFDMGRSHAYRLIAHAQAVYELAEAAGIVDVSPMGDIPERLTRDADLSSVAAEVEKQAASLPADATDEDRAEVVRDVLATQTTTTTTETTTTTFDPETGEIFDTANSGSDQSDSASPDAAGPGDDERDASPAPSPAPKVAPPNVAGDPVSGYRAKATTVRSSVRDSLLLLDPERVVATSDSPDHWRQFSHDVHTWLDALDAELDGPRLKAVQ